MEDSIFNMIRSNPDGLHLKVEMKAEDLLKFSEELIRKARTEIMEQQEKASDEGRLLTKKEVLEMFDVCDTTLWHWGKNNLLKPIKIGSKVMYRLSDVKNLLNRQRS